MVRFSVFYIIVGVFVFPLGLRDWGCGVERKVYGLTFRASAPIALGQDRNLPQSRFASCMGEEGFGFRSSECRNVNRASLTLYELSLQVELKDLVQRRCTTTKLNHEAPKEQRKSQTQGECAGCLDGCTSHDST